MKKAIVILGVWLAGLASSVAGAAAYEHPRVAELEDKLTKDAHTYLKGRFPDLPFLVNVKIDPLFRTERNEARGGASTRPERLPYFDLDSEEIRDEWDDPELSLMALMMRVRKTNVTISLPSTTSESEAAEIRDSIFALLHLNQARDEVTIQRRSWSSQDFRWETAGLILLALVGFLTGLMIINRASTSRLAKALSENKGGSSTMVMPSMPTGPARTPPRSNAASSSLGGNVKVNDPIRLKDIVVRMAEQLSRHKGFPTHLDMFEMDSFGLKNPSGLGALLVEFPAEVQRKIFSFSAHDCWLQALNEPGVLDLEVLELMQKLMRNNRDEHQENWEQLVLAVWRLGDQRAGFVKSLSKDEGFTILHAMPKGVALSTARSAFPGSWAAILDTEAKASVISGPRMKEISEAAFRVKPLNDGSVLRRYRQELELLSHLKTSDPYEEREIYQVLATDSQIREQRAPFFPVFEAPADLLKKLINSVALDQWAMALYDAKPQDKARIEELFNDKQRFIYNEKARELAALKHVDQDEAGAVRELLAVRLQQVTKAKESEARLADKEAKESALKMKRRKGLVDEGEKKADPKDINRAA